jgi:predicted HicB family RNase H-like nuclease
MNNLLKYKNYMARVEFDPEDKIFFGRIAGLNDIITFQGETVNELISGFEEAVDDYLATCQKLGHEPNQPCSGNLLLKISTETHAAIMAAAVNSGKTINEWANDVLNKAALV